jgi:hypothetical protein
MATISGKQLKDASINLDKLSGYDADNDKLSLNASTVSVKDTLDVGSPVIVLGRGKIDQPPSFIPFSQDAGVLVHSSFSNQVSKRYNGVVWDASSSKWIFVTNATFSSDVVDTSNDSIYANVKMASISSGDIVGTSTEFTFKSITGYTNIGTDDATIYPNIGSVDRAVVGARVLDYKFARESFPNPFPIASGTAGAYTEIGNSNIGNTTFFAYGDLYVKLPNAFDSLTFATPGTPSVSIVGIEFVFKTFGSNKSIHIKVADYVDGENNAFEHYIDEQGGQTGIHITGDNPCVTVRCVGSNSINGTLKYRWVTMHYTGSYHTN